MSLELFFPTGRAQCLRIGPLASDIDGFAAWLAAEGYARAVAGYKLCFVRNLSRWLEDEGLGLDDLDEQCFESFHLSRQTKSGNYSERATGRHLLKFLRENSRIPRISTEDNSESPLETIERTYVDFLINQRGLNASTVSRNVRIVRWFLSERFGTKTLDLEDLTAQDANRFILRHSQQFSRSYIKSIATALRSFLHHLYGRGDIALDLGSAILPFVHWKLAGLSKALAREQVELLLQSCDRTTAVGRRNYAILLLLARLGLRANEIVLMTLDDLDWNKGLVTISGKGQRRDALPLPHDVGEALVAYLRDGRPRCSTRRLFVRMQAPYRGLASSSTIRSVVRRSLARAGIDPPFKGSHTLRHSLATNMLRNGASLEDIGQILRHRHPETTQIYAKLDDAALRTLELPWPGDAS